MQTTQTAVKNLIDLAQSKGSTATTTAGARRYLINRLSDMPSVFSNPFHRSYEWQQRQWLDARFDRAATGRARVMGLPMESSDYRMRMDARLEKAAREEFAYRYQKPAISISDALCKSYSASWDRTYTYIAISTGVVAVVRWDTDSDWHYYSKSYGRPRNTYSNRRVDFCAIRNGQITVIFSNHVDSFRGEFLREAIAEYSAATGDITAAQGIIEYDHIIAEREAAEWTAYKIVKKASETEFRSVYNSDYVYTIGKQISETAKPKHSSGLYVWRTLEEARRAIGRSEIYCDGDAIIECRVAGKTIEYENGKIAVSKLTPVAQVK